MENGWKTAILVGFALDSNFASIPLATARILKEFQKTTTYVGRDFCENSGIYFSLFKIF